VIQSIRKHGALFAALVLLAASMTASAAAQTAKKCYDCKGTGLLACPNKDCKQEKVCGTKLPHKCDNIYGQECCRGTQKILCPKCKDPIVATELQAELDARKAWLDEMRKIDRGSQTRFAHVETDRWKVHCSFPAWKVGDATYSRVRIAHLWADRLEDTSTFAAKVLGKTPAQKQTANLVTTADEAMRTTLTLQGVGHAEPFKTMAPAGIFTTRPHEEFINDDLFHPHVVHNAAHVIMHATGAQSPQFFTSWFHEAFAHWVEIEKFKQQRTFCYHEVGNKKDPWLLADWKKQIYGEVVGRKDEPLAMIMTRDTDRQSARDRAHGWAFLEFMMKTRKPEEFKKFFDTLKESNGDTKKALQAGYGWSTAAFQEKWREYVIKNWAP
jgi:hypothetical protein